MRLLKLIKRPSDRTEASMGRAIKAPRGQVLVIFAFMLTILIGMAAFVVDLAWIWSHQLQVQRAADAGALAGVVYLPGNVPTARSTALDESRKNGYRDNVGGVDVVAGQDADNERMMVVTVSAPVDTFFMRLFGYDQVTVQRTGKAEFVLPVPMGSPQNYYGVGEFQQVPVTTTTLHPGATNFRFTTAAASGGDWSTPGNATTTATPTAYATEGTDNDEQAWQNFGLQAFLPNDPTLVIDGIEVRLRNAALTGSSGGSNCRVDADLSWNGGSSYTNDETQAITSTTNANFTLGSDTEDWGRTWSRANFSDSNFRVRLTWQEPGGCGSSRGIRLDALEVRVIYHTSTSVTTPAFPPIIAPDNVTTLTPQYFWGAAITLDGNRTNGDQHGPANDGGSPNPDHDPGGYDYSVEVGAGGEVWVFDAGFCETAGNGTGGWYGAGDHWIGSTGTPVTTEFSLYNTAGTPYNESDDVSIPRHASFPNLTNQNLTDQSGDLGTPRSVSGAGDCSDPPHNAWHNKWVPLATGLAAGEYRVKVSTASALNNNTNAENGWSLWVTGGATPRVYGGGRMVAYNNLQAGQTDFYLAQIGAEHAGKTLEMQLFDPDASANARLSILSPDGGVHSTATFDYEADGNCTGASDSCSATNRTQIQVVSSGGAQGFNNSVVTITIPLPTNYGSGGLAENGWWKIRYNVSGGNDTTTWKVTIRGNPVHLVVP